MKTFSLITASIVAGSAAGLFVDTPIWLKIPVIILCAAGGAMLYRLLAGRKTLSPVRGVFQGLCTGVIGGVFGTWVSLISGRMIVRIMANAGKIEEGYAIIRDSFFSNLVVYSLLCAAGGVVGAFFINQVIRNREKAGRAVRGPRKLPGGARALFNVLGVILGLLLGVVLPALPAAGTLLSLTEIDDHPFYVMSYKNDYHFNDLLRTGITRSDAALSRNLRNQSAACTCFAALNPAGHPRFGRNHDRLRDPALLVYTSPPDGYASVTMVDLGFLGIKSKNLSLLQRVLLLFTPYLPMDGMNECGLAIGGNTVARAEPSYDPGKKTLFNFQMKRLVLDYAKNVEEAIALFSLYNIEFRGCSHFLLADSSGKSAVVEFIDRQMIVIRNQEPWQVTTNFNLYKASEKEKAECQRYIKATTKLKQVNGLLSQEDAMALLNEVQLFYQTVWSISYDLRSGDFRIALHSDYDTVYDFTLPMKADR